MYDMLILHNYMVRNIRNNQRDINMYNLVMNCNLLEVYVPEMNDIH